MFLLLRIFSVSFAPDFQCFIIILLSLSGMILWYDIALSLGYALKVTTCQTQFVYTFLKTN